MDIAVGLVMIAVAVAYVAAPFFTPQLAAEAAGPTARELVDGQKMERQKLEAYAAIKEAEFDYRMGKLSDSDFTATRDKYAGQALEAIAALEPPPRAAPRQAAAPRRSTRIAFCPSCGDAIPPRANFCPACGRSLAEAVA